MRRAPTATGDWIGDVAGNSPFPATSHESARTSTPANALTSASGGAGARAGRRRRTESRGPAGRGTRRPRPRSTVRKCRGRARVGGFGLRSSTGPERFAGETVRDYILATRFAALADNVPDLPDGPHRHRRRQRLHRHYRLCRMSSSAERPWRAGRFSRTARSMLRRAALMPVPARTAGAVRSGRRTGPSAASAE